MPDAAAAAERNARCARAGAGIMGISMGKVVKLETPRTGSRALGAKEVAGGDRRPRSFSAAGASPAAFTRSARCARSICWPSTGPSTSSTSTWAPARESFIASMMANGITPEEMMRVLNRELPSPIRDIDLGTLLRPNYGGFAAQVADVPAPGGGGRARVGRPHGRGLGGGHGHRAGQRLARGHLHGPRNRELRRGGALGPRPHQRLPPARRRAVPDRHRPRHHRADRAGRGRVGRRPDLDRGRGLGRAADDLRAGRDQRPRVHRRWDPVDHERRYRGRARRQVHRRHQPAGPLRQRFQQADPDVLRNPRAARLRHGRSRRSATRPSGSSPTSACTSRSSSGSNAIRAWTSS